MSKKDLKFFMREEKEEIVTAPAPDTFVDDEGKPIELEIRVLSNARVQEIFASYRKRSIATNSKGAPYLGPGSEVLFKTERDSARAVRHIIAEALVYPNLQDEKLMSFYKCNDITEMPLKVFPRADEYAHVSQMVMSALGLSETQQSSDDTLIDDAKN